MDKQKRTKGQTMIYKTLHRTSSDMQIKQLNEKKSHMGSINEKWKAFGSRKFQNIPIQIKE